MNDFHAAHSALTLIQATVEPGSTGFETWARELTKAARHAGFEVDTHGKRVSAVYGDDVRAVVDLSVVNSRTRVDIFLDCPDEEAGDSIEGTTTEEILCAYITHMDARRLPGYLEALKSNADSLHPDWRHGHQGFHELINHAKQVFK